MMPVDEPLPELMDAPAWTFRTLEDASAHPGHDLRLPVLTSVGLDGRPEARTVVLREVRAAHRELVFHTDRRSPKVAQLRADARTGILFYERTQRFQLRLAARAEVLREGARVDHAWSVKSETGRLDHSTRGAPGTPLSDPARAWSSPMSAPCEEALRTGREHFCLVLLHVVEIDLLRLRPEGHRRSRHVWREPERRWESGWITP